ncbi:hypothetical protein ACFWGN_03010 [Oerskovia sp. NPDC060338]|uniref:hypothetical protein n=1 Tax=Oerskovia sp. NPDC060338 TaxID=3347100 RepID=UPI00364790F9
MIGDLPTDIPRGFTAFAEWSACLVYILLLRKRFTPPVLALALGLGLGLLWAVQTFAGGLPIALWTLGMAMAVAAMFAVVVVCADVSTREAGYFTARAFVLAELVASLHWQLYSYAVDQGSRGSASRWGCWSWCTARRSPRPTSSSGDISRPTSGSTSTAAPC